MKRQHIKAHATVFCHDVIAFNFFKQSQEVMMEVCLLVWPNEFYGPYIFLLDSISISISP